MLTPAERERLRRVLMVAQFKGGVGKSSTCANVAAQAADSGLRVLVVDIDPQGNIAEDLGFTGDQGNDRGAGLFNAIVQGTAPSVLRDVRPRLDVIPGGPELFGLIRQLVLQQETTDPDEVSHSRESLARVLLPLASRYDLVIIDTPPVEPYILDLALVASRWLLIPTQTDDGSRKGLNTLADLYLQAREVNADLELLGILITFVASTAQAGLDGTIKRGAGKRGLAEARRKINEDFGGEAPLFPVTIPYIRQIADTARSRGLLAHELEAEATNAPKWYQRLRESDSADSTQPILTLSSAQRLTQAYFETTQTILSRLQAEEDRLAARQQTEAQL